MLVLRMLKLFLPRTYGVKHFIFLLLALLEVQCCLAQLTDKAAAAASSGPIFPSMSLPPEVLSTAPSSLATAASMAFMAGNVLETIVGSLGKVTKAKVRRVKATKAAEEAAAATKAAAATAIAESASASESSAAKEESIDALELDGVQVKTTKRNVQGCLTTGGKTPGQPCVFPFTTRGKTYSSCTYDLSYVTGNKPWCSTKVDRKGNHIRGKWGTCENRECPIPPRECGRPKRSVNAFSRGSVGISQLPWMVSLGTFQQGRGSRQGQREWSHQCGGSLITSYYVLTAAHCFALEQLVREGRYKMRMGNEFLNGTSQHEVIRTVVQVFRHPGYVTNQLYYDVGLARADRNIEFTDYVRPICLPFRPVDDEDDLANNFVSLAGWGYDQGNNVLPTRLLFENLRVNPKSFCGRLFNRNSLSGTPLLLAKYHQQIPLGMQPDISCAGCEICKGACLGDSGSPLIRVVTDTAREPYYEQVFVVSGGFSCELDATIYARLTNRKILNWIQRQTDTTPLLMVVGGFNRDTDNGLLSDVELISKTPNNLCSKRVRPLPGRYLLIDGQVENEAAALGMVGSFTHGTALVCAGKNGENNQDRCYAYDPLANEWNDAPSMLERRYQAAAVLEEHGDMWVLGGADGSRAAGSTEIFDYRRQRWRRGKPLPDELRDSGLSSHCAVSINKTHVLVAGGYASDYTLCSPHANDGSSCLRVFGASLNKVWLYDGYFWEAQTPLSSARDRPACSLVQLKSGRTQLLVAGGCEGWCGRHPPVAKAEMYDPDSRTWRTVAPLPVALSSAKMELLDGLPTVVGGYVHGNMTQNRLLYQYDPDEDRWEPCDKVEMRIPRSSAAVFQVPRSVFPYC